MVWDNHDNEDGWLSKCAVGILKDFFPVSSVNLRLNSRGFSFSSLYLGDRHILWVFESDFERDFFIKNRFFLDDKFSLISKWDDSFNPQARLVWIDCIGVPLKFWNEAFFHKVGRQLGETVMVEEETLLKKRFDRGRILVLIPLKQSSPDMIRVSAGSGFFNIKISGASLPVDFSWPEKLLGLQAVDTQSCSNFCPNLERQDMVVQPLFVSHGAKEMVRSDDSIKQVSDGKEEVLRLTHQIKNREDNDSRFLGLVKAPALNSLPILEKTAGGPGVNDRKQLIDCNKLTNVCSQFQNSNKKGNDSRKVESLSINSTYSKLRKDKGNSRVIFSRDGIEKIAKVGDVSSVLQDDVSNSSLLLSSRFGKGEILNQVDVGLERKEVGLKVDRPGRALVEWASCKFERTTQSLDLKAQSGGMAIIDPTSSKFITKVGIARRSVDESEEGLDEVNEEGVGRDVFGSEVGEVGNVGSVHDRPIKSIGRKKNLLVKSYGMITRLSKATDFRNENIVPEEMKASWNLKEEIAKVIKAGRVLGLNFNGREKDMVEEIVRGIKGGTFDLRLFFVVSSLMGFGLFFEWLGIGLLLGCEFHVC
ncbi:hypothetical protein Q3G72_009751 [Acer saccharum]|nr:hypothetical protein Q3G72_009751 [Acer saccharum]